MLLAEMSYELIPAVDHAEKLIRDAKDQPILNAAIVSDVDIILTGDKDFLSLDMEHPKCMTVAPVSYTHLDVYKRQCLSRSPSRIFNLPFPAKLATIEGHGKQEAKGVEPVSYTHL